MTVAGLHRLAIRLSRALLAEGAVLAFGHDWRDDGIMDAVCSSAIDSFGTPGIDVQPPLILNLIPWPDSPRTADDALLRLEGILAVEEAGLPQDVAELSARASLEPDLRRYLRSRSLTHLRRQLTGLCSARISIGGREREYSGRYPGVFEEILFALEEDQPTYLAGLLGGITETLGQAIQRGGAMPSGFGGTAFSASENGASPIADLYAVWGQHTQGSDHPEDRRIDPLAAWETARRLGAERLDHNGLSEGENLRLLETTVEEEAILLILKGLRTVRERSSST
jgi:SLOG cluster2